MHLLQLTILISLACVGLARPQGVVNVVGPDVVPAPGQAKIGSGTVKNPTVEKKKEATSVTSRPNDKANDKFGGVTIVHAAEAPSTTAQPGSNEEVPKQEDQDIINMLSKMIRGSTANEGQNEPKRSIVRIASSEDNDNNSYEKIDMNEDDVFNRGIYVRGFSRFHTPSIFDRFRLDQERSENSIDSDESDLLDVDLGRSWLPRLVDL